MSVRIVKIVDNQHFANRAKIVMCAKIVTVVKIYAHVAIVILVTTVQS